MLLPVPLSYRKPHFNFLCFQMSPFNVFRGSQCEHLLLVGLLLTHLLLLMFFLSRVSHRKFATVLRQCDLKGKWRPYWKLYEFIQCVFELPEQGKLKDSPSFNSAQLSDLRTRAILLHRWLSVPLNRLQYYTYFCGYPAKIVAQQPVLCSYAFPNCSEHQVVTVCQVTLPGNDLAKATQHKFIGPFLHHNHQRRPNIRKERVVSHEDFFDITFVNHDIKSKKFKPFMSFNAAQREKKIPWILIG